MQRSFIKNQQRYVPQFIVWLFVVVCVSVTYGQMQLPPSPEHGFQPAGSYALSNIETINTANGNMMLRIPIAALPPGRGNSPGIQLSLVYNSKLYDTHIEEIPDEGTGQIIQQIHLNPSEQGGWHFDYAAYALQLIDRIDLEGWTPCEPGQCAGALRNAYIYKLKVIFPDSGEHEFRPLSYVDALGDGYYNISPNGLQWGSTCNLFECSVSPTQLTSGMTYYSTDGTFMRLDIPYSSTGAWNSNWTLTFPDGRRLVQTPSYQRHYDRNNNYTDRQSITYNSHPATKILDELGRSIIVENAPSATLIHTTGPNGEPVTTTVTWKTIYAYKPYRAATSSTQHGNVYATTGSNTPIVVDQIILPSQAGSLAYTFTYNAPDTDPYPNYSYGWGEINSITLPSGASASYAWTWDGSALAQGPMVSWVLQAAVTRKDLTYLAEYDGASTPITDTWTYSAPMNYGTSMTITGPDGGITRNYSANNGPFARLAYKTENPDGSMVERIWQENIPYQNPAMDSGVNSFIKTEFTSIKNGAGSFVLTSIKDYGYDKNGNVIEVKEYDWTDYMAVHPGGGAPVIPAGVQPKRVTVNTFFNSTPEASDTSYNANVYNQPTAPQSRTVRASTEVRDNSQPVSRTEFFYDNSSTTANLTQVKTWDSTKGSYSSPLSALNSISVSTQYNVYGGPILTTDAKGIHTQMVYGAVGGFTDLYPTQIKSAYGTAVQRTELREYSFSTGLVKRVTDDDNDVSSSTDFDAFGRPTLTRVAEGKPEESRTTTEYSDTARRVTVRGDLSTVGDGKLVTVQHYDQLGRVRLTRQLEDAGTQSATDETTGVKAQTRYRFSGANHYLLASNPYRAATSAAATAEPGMGWTMSKSDNAGRIIEVQTFGGTALPAPWGTNSSSTGTVNTTYDANFTTVSDQTQKQRRSATDGLGRLIRVDEPDLNGNLGPTASPNQPTHYSYGVLDNLTQVMQSNGTTTQQRNFVYSSLSRLTQAANPESGMINYKYDESANLVVRTDARGVSTHYAYDAVNRVTRRWYNNSDSPSATTHNAELPGGAEPTSEVNFYYDSLPSISGRPEYSPGASIGRLVAQTYGSDGIGDYFAYDNLGRVTLKYQRTGTTNYDVRATYNRSGAITSLSYPSGHVVNNAYDQAGRLLSLGGNLGDGVPRTYSTGILYSPLGGMVKEQFGTNTAIYNKLFYNSRGQLTGIRASTSYTGPTDDDANRGGIINHYSSAGGSDNNGNLKKQEILIPGQTNRVQEYEYDSLNRLSSATEKMSTNVQWSQTFTYDRWGNRTIVSPPNAELSNKTFTINAANNRYGVPSGQTGVMQYDAVGNLTNDTYTGAGVREYDAENKMTNAMGLNGQSQVYVYDGSGQRIKRIVNGTETRQVYGIGGELLAEYSANGTLASPQKEYGYRNGQLLVTASAAPRLNVAASANGGTATASETHSAPYAPSGAINGDRKLLDNNAWSNSTATLPQWFQVDFNGSKVIDEIDVFSVQNLYNTPSEPTPTMTFSAYGLTAFEAQYWNGSSWVTVPNGSVSGNNLVWKQITFSPVTTTKIRLWITGTSDGYSRLTEIEAWGTSVPVARHNVAASANGGTATASETHSAPYAPSGAINGDRKLLDNNAWSNSTATLPQWFQVDFNGSKVIDEIDVFSVQNLYNTPSEPTPTMTFNAYGLTAFEAQYWNGSSWLTVPNGSVAGNNLVWKQITFSPVTTTKIRLWITGTSDGYSRLTEIEAWGTPSGSGGGSGAGASTINWLVADHLGTPRIILDQSGELANVKRHDYAPFGEELITLGGRASNPAYSGGDAVRQQFTQKERDFETGLDYFLARYHSSSQARFTSPDPYDPIVDSEEEDEFAHYLGQPQNWNRYLYVWNNPLSFIDPNGEKVYVVTYTFGNSSGDDEFRRAAETREQQIRNSKGFDPKKDTVLLAGVKTKEDFAGVIKEANGLKKQYGKVEQISLFSHSGSQDGPVFHDQNGNATQFTQSELSNLRVNWSTSAVARFYGCYTGKNFAQNFANAQRVPAYGYDRYAYFSTSPDKRTSNETGRLYLIATDGYENGTWLKYMRGNSESYPMVRRDPTPAPRARRRR